MEAICKVDYDIRVKVKEEAEKEALREKSKSTKVLQLGFYDIYGVWFFGNLCDVVRKICLSKFDVDLQKMMHVFIDTKPDGIPDGIHDITVYGYSCRLFKWKAQGYHRGLVVLIDDVKGCAAAQVYMASGTWTWKLNDNEISKLEN